MAWYEVDSFVIDVGSIAWGDITRTHTDDGNKLGLNEVAADPNFDYTFIFENIPGSVESFNFHLNGYYDGSIYNTVKVYAWNYTFGFWSQIGTVVTGAVDQDYSWTTLDPDDWTSGGQAKIRFYCDGGYGSGGYLRIDELVIEWFPVTTTLTTSVPTTEPPTSVPPTTIVPTTVVGTSPIPVTTAAPATTVAPTTSVPTTALTTAPPPTTATPVVPDANHTVFNCFGNNYAGVLIVEITISGNVLESSYGLEDLELSIPITITGCVPQSSIYTLEDLELQIPITIEGWGVSNDNLKNWVAWSKIGNVSFVLDRTNDAGRRPMSWAGTVYQTLQLGNNVVIYGAGGVTRAFPVTSPAPTFGFKDISLVGVKNKTAVVGDQFIHFYIDITGCLWAVSVSINQLGTSSIGTQRLGFEEFLLPLVNPVLSWDAAQRRLYISDESIGYIYNDGAMTGGFENLTGLYRVKNDLKVMSPDELVIEPVYIVTDIIDFKRRGLKSIENVNTDAISELPLYIAIDYRYDRRDDFKTTQWTPVNKEGIAHIRVAGIEFRIRMKSLMPGTFDITYMRIHHKYIDQRFTRDPKEEIDDY